jgi:transcriptional regulator with XRE-family HTH domain
MAENEVNQEKKRKNAPFLYAFDYLASSKGYSQKELAESIGTRSPLISDYRAGKKLVGLDMKQRIAMAFKGTLYMPFLDGLSEHMFIKDVPDDEIIGNQRRSTISPDGPTHVIPPHPIEPFAQSQWQMIIDSQKETIATQKETIATLQREVDMLRQEIDRLKSSEFSLVVADNTEPD